MEDKLNIAEVPTSPPVSHLYSFHHSHCPSHLTLFWWLGPSIVHQRLFGMAFPRLLLLLCIAHHPITLTQRLDCLGQLLSCLVHSLLLKSSNEHKDNICCVMGSTLVLLLWQALSIAPCVTLMFCVCFLSPSIDNYNLITTIDNYSMITSIDNYNTITTINKYNMITTNNMILPEQLSHHLLRWHSRPRAEKNVVKTNLFRPFCTEPGLGAVIAQKSFTQKIGTY